MKKSISLIMLCLSAFISNNSIAQTNYKKNAIKINLAGFFFGDGNFAFERAFNKKNSVQINSALGIVKSNGIQYQLNGLSVGYRNYFRGNVENGFYGYGEVGTAIVSANDQIKKEKSTSYLWRLNSGYKRTFSKGLTLEAGLGIDGFGNTFKQTKYNGYYNPLFPYLNIGIGYSF
jgi:hypothetical protein